MTITETVVRQDEIGGDSLLSASDVTVRFGGLRALSEVSVNVPKGAIIGLVGPNGAGKSTLFGVLSGLLKPNAGRVRWWTAM